MSKVNFAVIAFVLFGLLSQVSATTTLDHNQCTTFYVLSVNSTYVPETVCGPEFPRINKNLALNKDDPVFILPDYNFSVKISESTFQQQLSTVLENEQNIDALTKTIKTMQTDMGTLNENLVLLKSQTKEDVEAQLDELKEQMQDIQNDSAKSSSGFLGIPNVVWLFVVLIAGGAMIIVLPKLQNTPAPGFQSEPSDAFTLDDVHTPQPKKDIAGEIEKLKQLLVKQKDSKELETEPVEDDYEDEDEDEDEEVKPKRKYKKRATKTVKRKTSARKNKTKRGRRK